MMAQQIIVIRFVKNIKKRMCGLRLYIFKIGGSFARNIGVENATGKHISFLDSDDWLDDSAIEYLYNKLVEYDADISIGNYLQCIQETQEWLFHVYQSPYYEKCWNSIQLLEELPYLETVDFSYTHVWGRIYKKELFATIRSPINISCEDLAVNYQLYGKAKKMCMSISSLLYGENIVIVSLQIILKNIYWIVCKYWMNG